MKLFLPRIYTLVLTLVVCQFAFAQPSLQKWLTNTNTQRQAGGQAGYRLTLQQPTQASVMFTSERVQQTGAAAWVSARLGLRQGVDVLRGASSISAQGNISVNKLQQYYKGIKVEHGIISTMAKAGTIANMQMEFYSVADNFNINASVAETQALEYAKSAIGGTRFAWEGYAGNNPEYQKPKGELVIVEDMQDSARPCLAWKFEIYSVAPLRKAWLYIHAQNGKTVLIDHIIKHANEKGKANTRYSGQQEISTTKDNRIDPLKPYILRQIRNGHDDITTLNYNRQDESALNDAGAVDFIDNDNDWNEYNNANKDDAALDAHFNMGIVSDYWKQVHGRNGWDNNNSSIISYVHVTKDGSIMDNAYWSGKAMYYGDGESTVNGDPPQTSIDDCGHELGHAICQSTAGLVYRWESGAINEAFSDIWAACITNFAVTNYPALGGTKDLWRLFEETSSPTAAQPGLRDMSDPHIFNNPDTYKDPATYVSNGVNKPMWRPATYEVCPDPNVDGVDFCGVHSNSGVLNKWFYLITDGGSGTNGNGNQYSILGLGFDKSEKIAYQTELNLTPNAGYSVCRDVSVNAAAALFGEGSTEWNIVREAWLAVGVDSLVYNQSNTPVFATSSFTAIAVGKSGHIWAGTDKNGVYKFNGTAWEKAPDLLGVYNNNIRDMKTGFDSSIWIAQSGRSGAQALQGGAVVFPKDNSFNNYSYYAVSDGLPSLNATSIYVDTFPSYNPLIKRVWVATMGYITGGTSKSGGVGNGVSAIGKAFSKITDGLQVADGTGGCQTIGGNRDKTWVFSSVNGSAGQNQIVEYSAITGLVTGVFDSTNTPNANTAITNAVLAKNFTAKSIFFDIKGRVWLGLQTNGLAVYDGGKWYNINFPDIFPAGTIVNNNAINGDKTGNIYIGTTNGLVVFNASRIIPDPGNPGYVITVNNKLDSAGAYRRYTTVNGLPSNNIKAIAIDFKRNKLPIATDNGIVFWDQVCVNDCYPGAAKSVTASLGSGNWSDASIWSDNKVPDATTKVIIGHAITVDVNGECLSLEIRPGGGAIHVNNGKKLTIAGKPVKAVVQTK